MKKLILLPLFGAILVSSCMNQNLNTQQNSIVEDNYKDAKSDHEQLITLGQTGKFEKENIKITFQEIVKDSRCPKEARCITAGVFQAKIKIKQGLGKAKTIVISDREDPIKNYSNRYTHGNYTIEISGVYPRKSIRKTNEKTKIGVTIHQN